MLWYNKLLSSSCSPRVPMMGPIGPATLCLLIKLLLIGHLYAKGCRKSQKIVNILNFTCLSLFKIPFQCSAHLLNPALEVPFLSGCIGFFCCCWSLSFVKRKEKMSFIPMARDVLGACAATVRLAIEKAVAISVALLITLDLRLVLTSHHALICHADRLHFVSVSAHRTGKCSRSRAVKTNHRLSFTAVGQARKFAADRHQLQATVQCQLMFRLLQAGELELWEVRHCSGTCTKLPSSTRLAVGLILVMTC